MRPFAPFAPLVRILDVTWLNELCVIDGDMLPPTRTLGHILSDMGYSQIEGRRVKIQKTRENHYIWFKNVAGAASSDVIEQVRDFFKKGLDEVPF